MIELESIHGKDFMPFVGEFSVPLAKQGVTFVVGENRVSRMAGSNGAGKTALFDAITGRDYIVIPGVTLVVAIIYLVGNLVVDVSYAFLDPRIRLR